MKRSWLSSRRAAHLFQFSLHPAPQNDGPLGRAGELRPILARFQTPTKQRLASVPILLDHLIGAYEQRLRHSETERLRSLEVNHQVVFSLLLHRQIGRFGALENLNYG